ncbi:GerAB/ArcD/ProY family transporter [Fredinandcohnia sp. 179-A 10B2 NHS]
MVSPYFLFFLMHSSQTGVGLLKYQSHIIKGASYDAWISVLVFGLLLHVVFFMMLYILKCSDSGDIISFHREAFGKIIGSTLNIIMACYFSIVGLFTLHTYIDILHIWVFDGIAAWELSLLMSVPIFYIVAGGFRIVTGVAYWGVIIPSFLLLSLIYLLSYAEISYLQPVFAAGVKDHFISMKEAAPIFLGFETVLVFLPFIKNRERSTKWGHIALFYTTILYTVIAIITFMYFTQRKLELLNWPTLTMIKIIQFPFLERFEFIFIFTWLLVIMPVICLYLWSAIRSIKLTIPKTKPTYVLLGVLAIFHFINSELVDIEFSYLLAGVTSYSGLVFLFGYIPLLFMIAVVRKKLKK